MRKLTLLLAIATIFTACKKEPKKEIDQKETFKSDDEVGFFFEQLKNIQSVLNSFNVKNL